LLQAANPAPLKARMNWKTILAVYFAAAMAKAAIIIRAFGALHGP